VAAAVSVLPAEQGLLWTLIHRPVEGLAAVAQLDTGDLDGLLAAPIFRLAASLSETPPEVLPEVLRERLSEGERSLLDRAASAEAPAAAATDCINTFRRLRVERALVEVQEEIDRLQERAEMTDEALARLWERKKELLRQLEVLN